MATHGACPFEGSDTVYPEEPGQGISHPPTGVVLVPTGASAAPAPACLPDGRGWSTFLGWSGPRSVALAVGGDADGTETDPVPVVSVDVETGVRAQLSEIPTSGNCAVSRLQVPAAPLMGSTDRTAVPTTSWDHGRAHAALALLGVLLLAGGVGLVVAAAAAVGRSVGQRLERSDDGPGAA